MACNKVAAPQVGTTLKRSLIVDVLAILVEQSVAEERGVYREAHDAVAAVIKVELQILCLLCFRLLKILLLLLFLLFLLLLLLIGHVLLSQGTLLLVHAEALVSLKVEEHQVSVRLSSPAAVAAVSGTVAAEQHGLASEHPLGVALIISAFGEVVYFAVARSIYQGDVRIVPTSHADVRG